MGLRQKNISTICCCIVVIITLLLMTAAWILSGFFRRELFMMSAEYIIQLQNPYKQSAVVFFNIIGIILEILIGPIIFIVYIAVYRRLNAIVYAIYMIFNIFLIMITKPAFKDPRPFWIIDQVQQLQWGCTSQFGFPSGHSWVSVIIFQPILSDFTGYGPCKWATLLLIFSGIIAPFSRLYLGVHTGDQLIMGVFMSLAMLVLYKFVIQKQIYKYVFACITGRHRIRMTILTILGHIIFIVVPIIIFQVNLDSRWSDQTLLISVNKRCKQQITVYQLEKEHMLFGAIGNAVSGLLYGVIIGSKFLDQQFWRKYYFGEWIYGRKRNFVFRFLLYVLFIGFCVGIFLFLIPHFVKNAYGSYFSFCVGFTLAGIMITFAVPKLTMKLSLIQKAYPDRQDQNPPPTDERIF